MKKIFALLFALTMLLSLAACKAEQEPQTGMKNPMAPVDSLEALSKAGGCALIKPADVNVTDEAFTMIDGTPKIASYTFKVDGVDCSLRCAPAGMDTDISGVYVEGGTIFADSDSESHFIENDDIKIARWFTLDGQYVFQVSDKRAWDWSQFDAICSQFQSMKPVNWSSDVSYEDYQAICDTYFPADEGGVNCAGSISIHGDHALVIIDVATEGGFDEYKMEATLQGDRLVYEKETIVSYTYGEDGTLSTDLPDGGAGYVTVKDQILTCEGAASEALRGLTLKALSAS